MEAIILAGGKGTRLRDYVKDVAKPMAPIAGIPFLEILLRTLVRNGFQRVIISVGHMAKSITEYFDDYYDAMQICFVVEDEPLGTGGGLRLAMEQVTHEHVYVFNGDTYLDLEFNEIQSHYLKKKCPIIVGCTVKNTMRYGRLIELDGKAIGFTERGFSGAGLINAGCYILLRGQLDSISIGSRFSFEENYLAEAFDRCEFDVFISSGTFIDIGIPEDYLRAQYELKQFIR